MTVIRTRLHVAADGTITGQAPRGVPPGEHEADITVPPAQAAAIAPAAAELWAGIRALQDEAARLPVLDPRTPDEILGYNAAGLFD
jgi:hypothetical protein